MAEPDIASIVAQLRDGGVYVAPSLSGQVSSADVAGLRALIARYPNRPTFVIAVPAGAGSPAELVAAVQKKHGLTGVFFVSRPEGDSWDLQAVKVGVVTHGRDVQATFVAFDRHPRDLGSQLLTAVRTYTGGSTTATSRATSAATAGPGTSTVVWWLGGAAALLVVAAALAVAWRRRRSGGGARRRAATRRSAPSASTGVSRPPGQGEPQARRGSHRR